MTKTSFEIVITVDEAGRVNIRHPDGAAELRDCIYFLELAKGTLMAKSLQPPANGSQIIPAHVVPKIH